MDGLAIVQKVEYDQLNERNHTMNTVPDPAVEAVLATHLLRPADLWCSCHLAGPFYGVGSETSLDRHRAHVAQALEPLFRARAAAAWVNGVDTAGQYADQPWVVDEECKPLNPYEGNQP